MKVLYIEDDPIMERLIGMYLHVEGHRLVTARDARQGLKLAYREAPDVILLDYHLPGINGLQALDLLKTTDRLRNVPIIAVTASAADYDCGRFYEAGCDGFVPKPVDRQRLAAEIKRVVQRAGEQTTV